MTQTEGTGTRGISALAVRQTVPPRRFDLIMDGRTRQPCKKTASRPCALLKRPPYRFGSLTDGTAGEALGRATTSLRADLTSAVCALIPEADARATSRTRVLPPRHSSRST